MPETLLGSSAASWVYCRAKATLTSITPCMKARSASVTGTVLAATSALEATFLPGSTLQPEGMVTPGATRTRDETIASFSMIAPSTSALKPTNDGQTTPPSGQ